MSQTVPPESPNFLLSTSCELTFPQVRPQLANRWTPVVHILFPRSSTVSPGAPHSLPTGLSTGVDNRDLPAWPAPPSVGSSRLPDRLRGCSEGKPSGSEGGQP